MPSASAVRRLAAALGVGGNERLELGADRFPRGHLVGPRRLVALGVARNEAIARAAEPLPDRF
jgi:hypothetical protein